MSHNRRWRWQLTAGGHRRREIMAKKRIKANGERKWRKRNMAARRMQISAAGISLSLYPSASGIMANGSSWPG